MLIAVIETPLCEHPSMRLYLSSFRMGGCPEQLVELARGGRRAAVIANATDVYAAEDRADAVEREMDALAALGFEAEEVDLRRYFDGADVHSDLQRYDVVWVRGGDVFTLRYTLARSGADEAIVSLLHGDAVVYGGYSAGPCVLGPTLRGLERVDNPEYLKLLYGEEPLWAGLGVLDFCVVPHVDSPDHPESPACNLLAEHYRQAGTPHRSLRDGDVLIVDGEASFVCS
jgi:dipeptidase E